MTFNAPLAVVISNRCFPSASSGQLYIGLNRPVGKSAPFILRRATFGSDLNLGFIEGSVRCALAGLFLDRRFQGIEAFRVGPDFLSPIISEPIFCDQTVISTVDYVKVILEQLARVYRVPLALKIVADGFTNSEIKDLCRVPSDTTIVQRIPQQRLAQTAQSRQAA